MTQSRFSDSDLKGQLIDIYIASNLLGVSTATIRNWIKSGEISYVNGSSKRNKYFEKKHIEKLKVDIQQGRTLRLNNRANKRNSTATFIPIEQLNNKSLLPILQSYIELIKNKNLSVQNALLIHGLSVLKKSGLVKYKIPLTNLNEIQFKNKSISKLISEWHKASGKISFLDYNDLLSKDIIFSHDSLGILYQSLLDEGKKSQGGSYYTPRKVIDGIVEELSNQINSKTKVLDPCCGTGQFLISFSNRISNPEQLWGFDIDPIAVQIAKINLMISYPNKDFYPNIYLADSLKDNINGKFDIIATNPPWGYHFSKEDTLTLKNLYPEVISNEAFSYFLIRSLKLLNEKGYLCFVLPESIMKIKQHKDIRGYILSSYKIKSINHLGNVFSKVLSPVITLNIQKKRVKENEIEVIHKDGGRTNPLQSRFKTNSDYMFDTSISDEDKIIIEKMYKRKHLTLAGNSDWALGIVTGNNNKFISLVKTEDNEGVLKGFDIGKYIFKQPTSFLAFKPELFQQVAPVSKYRAKEKLIYKFISSTLNFSYDNKQTLTLNSANILIPKFPDIPIKVVLAFLNSNIFQFIFKKKFNTVKILRGDLEKLPFPLLTNKEIIKIEEYVNDILLGKNKEDVLNELIYDIYNLTTEEKKYILNSIKK